MLAEFFALLLKDRERNSKDYLEDKSILNFANRMESLKQKVCFEARDGESKRV